MPSLSSLNRKLINGKQIAEQILISIQKKTKKLKTHNITPELGVILIGDNKASEVYVRKKQETAERTGINFSLYRFPSNISMSNLLSEMEKIQKNKKLSGLIVQLPIPEHLWTPEVLNAVKPELDVDCLTEMNFGKLIMNTNIIEPPTAAAVMKILENLKTDLIGKNICIIGTGALVGKPLAIMLMNARASVTTCNSKTKNIREKCREADIIITGVGKANIVRSSMVKKGAIVIDTGISFDKKGKLTGDVNVASILKEVKKVTPTPGGVGPITVAMLLSNVVNLAEQKLKK